MNVSIYNCALNIVNILAAFCVFQFSRIALNNNKQTRHQPTLLRKRNRVTRRCSGVGLLGTIYPCMLI